MTPHEWRRELLTERIRELNSVKFTIKGNAYCNYGVLNAAVQDMINEHDAGDQGIAAGIRSEEAQGESNKLGQSQTQRMTGCYIRAIG